MATSSTAWRAGGGHKDMYVHRSWPSLTSFEHSRICGFGRPRSLRWSRAHSLSLALPRVALACMCMHVRLCVYGTCLPSRSHSHSEHNVTRWVRATYTSECTYPIAGLKALPRGPKISVESPPPMLSSLPHSMPWLKLPTEGEGGLSLLSS